MSVITTDQLIRILIIVIPTVIAVVADGRITRARLGDLAERVTKLEARVDGHLDAHREPARRSRW